MDIIVSDPTKTEAIVKRALFLAYEQTGGTTGLGFLQAKGGVTEDSFWEGTHKHPNHYSNKGTEAYVDYGYGRMMKVGFVYDSAKGCIAVRDDSPRSDYQGWCGLRFPSYRSLIVEAAAQLGVRIEVDSPAAVSV